MRLPRTSSVILGALWLLLVLIYLVPLWLFTRGGWGLAMEVDPPEERATATLLVWLLLAVPPLLLGLTSWWWVRRRRA
jgi:hypothetical protein